MRLRRLLRRLLRCGRAGAHPRERVHEAERRGHRLERLVHRGMICILRLELRERATHVVERHVGVRRKLLRALDLVERAHRLCDRSSELRKLGRHRRIGL